eukprot:s1152_g8.t1
MSGQEGQVSLHVPWHALAASHQAMTVEEEEEHSPKSEASREADEADRLPVEKGQIRLHGHFCGVATTASHRLELAIPVREQVDINLLYPLLAGLEASFHKRAAKTAETDASPTSPDSPDSPKVELWTRLKDLLELDRISPEEESPELVEEVLQSLGPAWQETFERCNSRRSSKAESFLSGEDELKAALREEERELRARKAQERAMEIDIEAKEALVGRLMEQREELKMKTQELTKQLEQGVAERWFCGCLQGVSSLFSRKTEEAGRGSVVQGPPDFSDRQCGMESCNEDSTLLQVNRTASAQALRTDLLQVLAVATEEIGSGGRFLEELAGRVSTPVFFAGFAAFASVAGAYLIFRLEHVKADLLHRREGRRPIVMTSLVEVVSGSVYAMGAWQDELRDVLGISMQSLTLIGADRVGPKAAVVLGSSFMAIGYSLMGLATVAGGSISQTLKVVLAAVGSLAAGYSSVSLLDNIVCMACSESFPQNRAGVVGYAKAALATAGGLWALLWVHVFSKPRGPGLPSYLAFMAMCSFGI